MVCASKTGIRLSLLMLAITFSYCSSSQAQTGDNPLDRSDSIIASGDLDKALQVAREGQELLSQSSDPSMISRAEASLLVGRILMQMGQYSDAAENMNLGLEMLRSIPNVNDSLLVNVMTTLGEAYRKKGQYDQAHESLEEGRRLLDQSGRDTGRQYGNVLIEIGTTSYSLGQHEDAERLLLEGIAILSSPAAGNAEADLGKALDRLGVLYLRTGQYARADSLVRAGLVQIEAAPGPDHAQVASALDNLGVICHTMGRLAEAEEYYQRSHSMRQELLYHSHPDRGTSLSHMAVLLADQGRYLEAEPYYNQSVSFIKRTLGPDHDKFATALNNQAYFYFSTGRYQEAEPLYKEAWKVWEKALGPEHQYVGQAINNLAYLYNIQGRLVEAEPLYRRALALWEKALGPEHEYVARSLDNLAGVCRDRGDFAGSADLSKRALAIREHSLGADHLDYAFNLCNLANTLWMQLRYDQAEALLLQALEIREQKLGPDHPHVALVLNQLAVVYVDNNRLDRVLPLYQRALAIYESASDQNHASVADVHHNLSYYYFLKGGYERAEVHSDSALAIRKDLFGDRHPQVAVSLDLMSLIARSRGQYELALQLAAASVDIGLRAFADNSLSLSEKDALTYSTFLRKSLNRLLSVIYDSTGWEGRPLKESIATLVLAGKGQVADGLLERRQVVVKETDSTVIEVARQLTFAKFRQSRLAVQGPGEDAELFRRTTDSLELTAANLDTELSRYSVSYRQFMMQKRVSYADLVPLVPESTSLVEFVKYDHYLPRADSIEERYVALVIASGAAPTLVPLGGAPRIDSMAMQYRNHMLVQAALSDPPSGTAVQEMYSLARGIYDVLWSPLEHLVASTNQVFIAPDAALNTISFASLRSSQGRYLIEDKMIHRLASSRDLYRFREVSPANTGLLAMGNPDYNAGTELRLGRAAPDVRGSSSPAISAFRTGSPVVDISDIIVSPLPATEDEIRSIAQTWEKTTGESALVLTGASASEERFKELANGRRVIHLATHGFFLASTVAYDPSKEFDSIDRPADNVLLRSGVILAGANLHGEDSDDPEAEDGFLTAYEVSAMNLDGTDMVVLSACESGMGEVRAGEGVYGLRRAFQVAGVRTVVGSLWPVADTTTAQFFDKLYQQTGQSLPERLTEVARNTIADLRRSGIADHPIHWAAFVAVGDWRGM